MSPFRQKYDQKTSSHLQNNKGHEDENRIPLTKPNQPSPNTNSLSQLRNDITTKPDVKTNWSFAISNTSSINQKNLPQSLLFAKDNVTNILS